MHLGKEMLKGKTWLWSIFMSLLRLVNVTQGSLFPSVLLSTLCSLRSSQTPTHVLHPPLWSCFAQTHLHMQENPRARVHAGTELNLCNSSCVCSAFPLAGHATPRRYCDPGCSTAWNCPRSFLVLDGCVPFSFWKEGNQWQGTEKKDPSENCDSKLEWFSLTGSCV